MGPQSQGGPRLIEPSNSVSRSYNDRKNDRNNDSNLNSNNDNNNNRISNSNGNNDTHLNLLLIRDPGLPGPGGTRAYRAR